MKRLLIAAVIVLIAVPAWAAVVTYDGSVDPTAAGWFVWEGVLQGSVVTESDETVAWFLDDGSEAKSKISLGTGSQADPHPSEPNLNLSVGATVESRLKCTALAGSTPLNLGLQLYDGTTKVGHWVTAAPDKLMWNGNDNTTAIKNHVVDMTSYHVVRLCYRKVNLRQRALTPNAWAVYLDGSTDPILFSNGNPTGKAWSGPTWGSGNTGDTQQIYFDYIKYDNSGAYAPGVDSSIQFVNGDPDGVPNVTGTSVTISWETNVPTTGELHYSTDLVNWTVLNDPDPSLKTTHSITMSGTTPGTSYKYYAVSADASGKKAISLPAEMPMPNPFVISSGPNVAVAADGLSATITWQTSEAASSSEVHYGQDSSCSTVVVEPGPGGVTSHSVTVPTAYAKGYYYYVKSYHTVYTPVQSTVRNFYTYIANDFTLDNPNFDDGPWMAPWVAYKNTDGVISEPWFSGVTAHTSPRFWGAAASWGKKNGGAYQQVKAVPGTWYKAESYIYTYSRNRLSESDPPEAWVPQPWTVHCRIGIDPNGGTNPDSPDIQWCTPGQTEHWQTFEQMGWQKVGTVAKAGASGTITVFLHLYNDFSLIWNIMGMDTVTLGDESTMGPIDYQNHTGKAKSILKEGYPVSFTDKIVTTVWDVQTPGQYPPVKSRCYISEADGSSGILVDYSSVAAVLSVGNKISVSGNLNTEAGETQLTATFISNPSPEVCENLPKPVVLTGKNVATGSLGVQPSLVGSGLSNAGVRVRVVGKVTGVAVEVGTSVSGGFPAFIAYVDDGTPVANDSALLLSGTVVPGIKVVYSAPSGMPYLIDDNIRLAVTGVAGLQSSSVGTFPVIWVNNGDEGMDINTFSVQ